MLDKYYRDTTHPTRQKTCITLLGPDPEKHSSICSTSVMSAAPLKSMGLLMCLEPSTCLSALGSQALCTCKYNCYLLYLLAKLSQSPTSTSESITSWKYQPAICLEILQPLSDFKQAISLLLFAHTWHSTELIGAVPILLLTEMRSIRT